MPFPRRLMRKGDDATCRDRPVPHFLLFRNQNEPLRNQRKPGNSPQISNREQTIGPIAGKLLMYGVPLVEQWTGRTLRWETGRSLCSVPNADAQPTCLFPAFQFRKPM